VATAHRREAYFQNDQLLRFTEQTMAEGRRESEMPVVFYVYPPLVGQPENEAAEQQHTPLLYLNTVRDRSQAAGRGRAGQALRQQTLILAHLRAF